MIESISWGKETDDVIDLSKCPENDIIIECPKPDPLYYQLTEDKVLEFSDGSAVVADSKAKLKIKQREIQKANCFVIFIYYFNPRISN